MAGTCQDMENDLVNHGRCVCVKYTKWTWFV